MQPARAKQQLASNRFALLGKQGIQSWHFMGVQVRPLVAWALQLAASACWVASVIVYGSYEVGDVLQLAAASCWTVSNLLALPDTVSSRPTAADARPVPAP